MDIEDDDGRHRKNRGTPQVIPVIMEDDDISIDNREQMAEEASIANSRTKPTVKHKKNGKNWTRSSRNFQGEKEPRNMYWGNSTKGTSNQGK
jgi:hypothetical protein